MPEGHSIHRLARHFQELFVGQTLRASSPQGRFALGARAIDGQRAVRAWAHGKHFFLAFEDGLVLNVHLGLYGAWTFGGDSDAAASSSIGAPRRIGEQEQGQAGMPGEQGPPAPGRTVRLRLLAEHRWADLVGATVCRVLEPAQTQDLLAGLGPDPLDPDADPEPFLAALGRTRRAVAAVLMDQKVLAGVGNIYRAELLFRAALDPHRPGRDVPRAGAELLWRDAVRLMTVGVEQGRIITTAPEHRLGVPAAQAWPEHAHYVYHRQGKLCRVCGENSIVAEELEQRRLYWCTVCQG